MISSHIIHIIFVKIKAGVFLAFFAIFYFLICSNQTIAQYTDTSSYSPPPIPFEEIPISQMVLKKHSPGRATIMSTILPGLGQAYNKQYWKIPIIYGGIAAVTYFAIDNHKGSRKFLKEYKYRINNGTFSDPKYANYPDQSILNLYNSYQKNFELSLIIGGIIYVLNIIDAYVFAHLFTFDLSDNLSMQFSPVINQQFSNTAFQPFSIQQPELGVQLKFTFK